MRRLRTKLKPVKGFAHFIHIGLNVLLPVLAYILVRIDFVAIAVLVVLISKWRIFAVRPHYWLANIISSSVDIIVGVSLILFMANTTVDWWQLFWMGAWMGWLTYLKPRSDVLSVSVQAMLGQLLGLSILYLKFGDAALPVLVAATWAITYLSARHFLTSFEEPHTALISHAWAYFAAGLAFVLGHWLLFYGTIAQIIVFLTTIGYSLAALYYLDATERLTRSLERQLVVIMLAILVIVVSLSNWSGAT
jgi:hypothetical protein